MRTWHSFPFAAAAVVFSIGLFACQAKPAADADAEADAEADADADAEAAEATEVAAADEVAEECLHGKAHEEGSCGAGAEVPTAGSEGHFGDAFALGASVPLSTAIEGLDGSSTVQVAGEVTSVCQAKGCWMVIKDHDNDEVMARVLMKDHKFSVPMDGKGKKAVVEGELTQKTLTAGQVKHLAKDAGEDPAEVTERKEYVLTASGVKLES